MRYKPPTPKWGLRPSLRNKKHKDPQPPNGGLRPSPRNTDHKTRYTEHETRNNEHEHETLNFTNHPTYAYDGM